MCLSTNQMRSPMKPVFLTIFYGAQVLQFVTFSLGCVVKARCSGMNAKFCFYAIFICVKRF